MIIFLLVLLLGLLATCVLV